MSIRHDMHTHTTWSDGGHSVSLQVLIGQALELEAFAITDHVTPGRPLFDSEQAFSDYVAEVRAAREGIENMRIFAGAEAVALDAKGSISIMPRQAEQLEWVLCDLGALSEGTLRNTPTDKDKYIGNVLRTYMGLCDVPYLDAIAHPFNTGNTTPAALHADYPETGLRELAQKMMEQGIVFDVMNLQVFWFQRAGIAPRELTDQYAELVKVFAVEGCTFQISSDDHRCGLGHTTWSRKVLCRAGVPRSQILDTRRIGYR